MWVGSEDSVIYIINVHSMSCNKQLTDHRAAVTGLVVHDGKKPRYQGPLGGRKGKSLAPRGVEGKGSWASPGKESLQETCVVWFCLWAKRKEPLRRQNQHGDQRLSASQPRLLRPAYAFGQNFWKGCALTKCWLWLVFSFSRHQKSGFVGETISKMPLCDMAPSGPESHQKASCLQADGGTSPPPR